MRRIGDLFSANLYRPEVGKVVNLQGNTCKIVEIGEGFDCFHGGKGVRETVLEVVKIGSTFKIELDKINGTPPNEV